MKKVFAIVLTLVMAASLLCISANAAATNCSTHEWSAELFPGALQVLEDGTIEYTKILNTWYGPTLEIYDDLLTMLGDKDKVDVTIAFDIKVRFVEGKEDNETDFQPMIRAFRPDDLAVDDWSTAYNAELGTEEPLLVEWGGNLMGRLPDTNILCYDTEWNNYETTLTISKATLNQKYIKSILLTFDSIVGYADLDAILIKNFGLYMADDYKANKPTPEPTPEPTATPEATEAPTATDAPAADATDAPADEKKGCGSVLALGLLAAVIPAAVAARKKEN